MNSPLTTLRLEEATLETTIENYKAELSTQKILKNEAGVNDRSSKIAKLAGRLAEVKKQIASLALQQLAPA